ncbi:hypothetical protein [Aquimarina agarivorans]|uniref:hypothetical protein n=1 Tax=Aquimarina agarivorans TaxID=980584 RepID=UPI000248FC56|nr:hypothetical protein [Aquimarina agarivorans]
MAIPVTAYNKTFLIPESNDPCEIWVGYFSKLKSEVGSENAKMLWLITWKAKGATSCLTNPSFNNWLIKNKIDVTNMATRTLSDLSEIGGNFLGMGKDITKILSIGIPVVLGSVLIGLIIIFRNTTKNATLTDLAIGTPAGSAVKLLKR